MSCQKMGVRNRSTKASQYRVGRYGRIAAAASSTTSTWLATSTARAPRAAPRAESVTVERNSATAATPSIDQPTYTTVRAIRLVAAGPDSGGPPDSAGSEWTPKRWAPTTNAVAATRTTATTMKATAETSLATSSRVRPTGRTSR